jgi:hypothetical protein
MMSMNQCESNDVKIIIFNQNLIHLQSNLRIYFLFLQFLHSKKKKMNLNDDSFSLLVCLAVLSARKKDNNGNALTVNAIANNINSTSTFGYHFDSSNALSTLHTARQILRAIFATRAMDNASRIAITNSCNSNVVVALYIGAMLSLQLAQHIADRILLCNGEFDDLLNVVLNSLQQHAIKGNSVLTTHSKHGKSHDSDREGDAFHSQGVVFQLSKHVCWHWQLSKHR